MINKILEKFRKPKKQEDTEELEEIQEEQYEYEEGEVASSEPEQVEGEEIDGEVEGEAVEAEGGNKKKIDKKLIAIGGGVAVLVIGSAFMLLGGGEKKAPPPKPSKPAFTSKPVNSASSSVKTTVAKQTNKQQKQKAVAKAEQKKSVSAKKPISASNEVTVGKEKKTVVANGKPIRKPFEEKKAEIAMPNQKPQNQYAYRVYRQQHRYNTDTGSSDIVKPADVFKRFFLSELDAMLIEKQKQLNELSQKLQTVEQTIEEKKKSQLVIQKEKGNVKEVKVVLPDVTIDGITCYGNKCSAFTNFGILFVGSKIGDTGEKVIRITPDSIVTNKRVIKYY